MKYFILFIFLIINVLSFSQNTCKVNFLFKDLTNQPSKNKYFKDSISAHRFIHDKIYKLQKNGFLLASIDSVNYEKNAASFYLFRGDRFQSAEISIQPNDLHFLRKKVHLKEKLLANYPFTAVEIADLKHEIQRSLENNGYPFVKVKLTDISFRDKLMHANLKIDKGPEVRWAKINIRGDSKISEKLICSYIQIKEGDLFSQETLELISSRLSLLPFVKEIKPAEILFTPWGVDLYLYLKNQKVSLADGVLGLQPKDNGKGYMLTGELKLKLVNELKHAETFSLNWRSIQKQTQSLDVLLNTPNLFRTRFGLDGTFNLYKRDTTYMDIQFQIGVQYALNNGSYLKFYYRNENSNILQGASNVVVTTNLRDTKTSYYGLQLNKQTLNYLPNPSKGYQLKIDAAVGQRKTKLPDSTIFDKSMTYKFSLTYHQFITLHRRNVLHLGFVGNYLGAPTFYQNDLFRFGGQLVQRGFNEEQLFANAFATATVEYRFLVDRNSYAFAFYDQSYYQNRVNNNFHDAPFGFGLGFTFGTKVGAFSISYALGKQKNSNISFKDGKIHFGYIAYF